MKLYANHLPITAIYSSIREGFKPEKWTTIRTIKGTCKKPYPVTETLSWEEKNDMKINPTKTKEMSISFAQNSMCLDRITRNHEGIERVTATKLLGITIQSNLK